MLTYWALRRAGMERRESAQRMVAFLVVLYTIYLMAVVVCGVLLRTGVLHGTNPVGMTIVAAALAGTRPDHHLPDLADPAATSSG